MKPLFYFFTGLVFTALLFPQIAISQGTGEAKSLPEKYSHLGKHILTLNTNGEIICRDIKKEEAETFLLKTEKQPHLTIVNSLNNPADLRGLKVLLRATDQLLNNKDALLSFRRAAARWERYIQTDITVVIDVDFGETRWGEPWGSGVLGSTNSAYKLIDFGNEQYAKVNDIVEALKLKHTSDSQIQDLYSAIPLPTPTTAGTNLDIAVAGQIVFQQLGFIASVDPDPLVNPLGEVPSIGFNSAFNFDFDPSDGIQNDYSDFDGVVTHEIGHALGFTTIIGSGGDPNNYFTPWDLFRVRPEAVEPGSLTGFSTAPRIVTPGPPPADVLAEEGGTTYYKANHVFFDGLSEIELSTATGNRVGGDGQQASHWRDDQLRLPSLGNERWIGIMDPVLPSGIREEIHQRDLRMLEVIGYDIKYTPEYAKILLSIENDTLDLDKSLDTLKILDTPLNGTKELDIKLTNIDLDNVLEYEIEILVETKFPENAAAKINLDAISGTLNSGITTTLKLTVGDTPSPEVFFGTIRFNTNDNDRLVIDIPFHVSVGGAIQPTIVSDISEFSDFVFNRLTENKTERKDIQIKNLGNLDLNYNVITALSDKSNIPDNSGLKKSVKGNSILSQFFTSSLLDSIEILFSTDFENDFSGFTASGIKSEDWQRFTKGPALLEGHSLSTTAYFGVDYIDSIRYRNEADASIISQAFDFSSILPEDLITLSFNYYLQAEEGYDFASVQVSTDGGKTFNEVATSNNGILKNEEFWQAVVIQLPFLSGHQDSVKIAFRFTSDQLIEDEGWFIDDVQISVIKNANSVYTIPRGGIISEQNVFSSISLFVNSEKLEAGYYKGALIISNNDPIKPSLSIPFNVSNLIIAPVKKNVLYGSTGRSSSGKLLTIDKSTGAATELGFSGYEPLRSITISPESQEIYGLNYTAFIPSSLLLVNATDGFALYRYETPVKLNCIVFDNDNTLYAASDNKKLYKLNVETGDTIFIGDLPFKIAALAITPNTGDLIATIDVSSQKDKIFKLDKNTADTSLIVKTNADKIIRGLVFDEKNVLFGVTGEDTQVSSLISIDLVTGNVNQIGSVNYKGVLGLALAIDSTTVMTESINGIPENLFLSQNYPNPFNPSTIIEYQIPSEGFVKLTIFDVLGREVKVLVNENKSAGYYQQEWNAGRFSSGVYLYQMEFFSANNERMLLRNKMVLTK